MSLDGVANETEANGIEAVQRFELAFWIPPFSRHVCELLNLIGVNCGCGRCFKSFRRRLGHLISLPDCGFRFRSL